MTAAQINLTLEQGRKVYRPGDLLVGQYRVRPGGGDTVKAIELSVLWYTEGKGEEDLAVHHFERVESGGGGAVSLAGPRAFSIRLPNSPLSYPGLIVKICWCVRVRLFLARGKDIVAEQSFQLGEIPPPPNTDEPASD